METNVKPINWDADVRDKRIMRINEIIATKLSSVSKGKRESLKADKMLAKFILENWDSEDNLNRVINDPEVRNNQPELWNIVKSRIEQLKKLSEKAAQEAEEKKRKEREEYILMRRKQAFRSVDDEKKQVYYSNNDVEKDHVDLIVDYLRKGYSVDINSWCEGRTRCQSVVCGTIYEVEQILGKENLIAEGDLTAIYPHALLIFDGTATKVYRDRNGKEIKKGCWVIDVTEPEEGKAQVQADEENGGKLYVMGDSAAIYLDEIDTEHILEIVAENAPKSTRKVGDLHPTKNWVWTEYKPGKFDWRTNKK